MLLIAACGAGELVDEPGAGEPVRVLTRDWRSPLGLTIRTYGLAIDGIPIYGAQQVEIYDASGALVHRAGTGDATLAALRARGPFTALDANPYAAGDGVKALDANPYAAGLAHTRRRAVWHLADGAPTPAIVTDRLDLRGPAPIADVTLTDAATGAELSRHRTMFEAEPSYLVYARPDGRPFASPLGDTLPHPTGVPDHTVPSPVPQQVHRQRTAIHAIRDPWLAPAATQTQGNNVVAFFDSLLDADNLMTDAFDEDGNDTPSYGPLPDTVGNDFFAVSANRRFEVPYDPDKTTDEYFQDAFAGDPLPPPVLHDPALEAKIIATFYSANWLHDFFYRAGFDEVAGNAQESNHGRGGVEHDPLIIHAGFFTTSTFPGSEGVSPVLDLGLNSRSASRRDQGIDFSTMSHEWGHYLIGRLAGGTGETDAMGNRQGLALHEGIADFVSVLVNMNAGADPRAAFAVGSYGNLDYIERRPTLPPGEAPADPMYYGIRRYPSSQDFAKNPLTFRHLAEPPPLAVPYFNWKGRAQFLGEEHTAGEVFDAALFECFGNLVRRHRHAPFEATRSRMAEYLVAGLAAFPARPTFLEARDAILTVIRLADRDGDYAACRAGFATRGMGAGALGPDRNFGSDDPFGFPPFDPATISESFVDADRAVHLGSSAAATAIRVDLRNTGLVDLDHTTLALEPRVRAAVRFPHGDHIDVADLAPEAATTATFTVRIDACRLPAAGPGLRALDYTVTAHARGLRTAATFHATVPATCP